MTACAIRMQGVVAQAGGRVLLDGIDLSVAHGERVAIVGHNGAGKSSLLKLMTGIMHPSHGEVDVLGFPMQRPLPSRELRRLRADVGQVFQGLHLVQRLTVLENVLLGSLARNRSPLTWARLFPRDEIRRAEAALQQVGLIGKADARADSLSGGERQKTAIARMLLQAPRLILADEPTAALDPLAAADIASMLSGLAQRQHMTLVTVVHDPGLLAVLADRVIGMRQGKIAFDLPVAQVGDERLNRLYSDKPDARNWITRLERAAHPIGEQP
ncbi:phosphonate ABC transporter ATP-binding protein [Noviherbaspirillum sp.]|uniref:phosphonate ABC transporter ATP-binding protein n=1 Tax=Noviherbaspirillum sp. TaxID=1926288 RepID=UPI002FE1A035